MGKPQLETFKNADKAGFKHLAALVKLSKTHPKEAYDLFSIFYLECLEVIKGLREYVDDCRAIHKNETLELGNDPDPARIRD